MKATLLHEPFLTVRDICDGFVYNELEGKGLFGWGGKLTIQPEYQRNYIYADGTRDVAVVDSLLLKESTKCWTDNSASRASDGLCAASFP